MSSQTFPKKNGTLSPSPPKSRSGHQLAEDLIHPLSPINRLCATPRYQRRSSRVGASTIFMHIPTHDRGNQWMLPLLSFDVDKRVWRTGVDRGKGMDEVFGQLMT